MKKYTYRIVDDETLQDIKYIQSVGISFENDFIERFKKAMEE